MFLEETTDRVWGTIICGWLRKVREKRHVVFIKEAIVVGKISGDFHKGVGICKELILVRQLQRSRRVLERKAGGLSRVRIAFRVVAVRTYIVISS